MNEKRFSVQKNIENEYKDKCSNRKRMIKRLMIYLRRKSISKTKINRTDPKEPNELDTTESGLTFLESVI